MALQMQVELPDGWEAATRFHRLKHRLSPQRRQLIEDRAVAAILARARALLRHAAPPTRIVQDRFPAEGELDLDATLEIPRPWQPADLVVERPEVRLADVVVVLDMSLSMTGDKIALVALATAILRLRLDRLSVISFDTDAHTLVPVGEDASAEAVVRRVLRVPAQGYTNIEAGLQRALQELRRSPRQEQVGIILTDGVANIGGDPVPVAARFPRLHVVQVGPEEPSGQRLCVQLARAGRGRRYRAPAYADLPAVVRRLIRECFR